MSARTDKHYTMQQIVLMVRDSRSTKGAQRQLLMAIAIRANAKAKYSRFPSYARLADDAQLDEVTLRRAAAALERKGLIQRRRRTNRSNLFLLQVPMLEKHAAEAREARAQEKHARHLAMIEAEGMDAFEVDDTSAEETPEDELAAILRGGR